ncbi:MAG: hypothetical protein ACKOUT_08835 [Novosphingobium sp.]
MKRKTLRRLPAFVPVPRRARADGWTPWRQAAFLGLLAETGSVRTAAERIGMARETAYRLRQCAGAESFAAAWDAIAARLRGEPDLPKRKVTHFELVERAWHGTLRPVLYRQRFKSVAQEVDLKSFWRFIAQVLSTRRDADDRSSGAG